MNNKMMSHPLFFWLKITFFVFLSGCSNTRLQTFEEFGKESAKTYQTEARNNCRKNNQDTSDYYACIKRVDDSFAEWRKVREKK